MPNYEKDICPDFTYDSPTAQCPDIIKLGKDYLFMTLGCFIYAFAVNYFYVSNHLAEGGVTGIALII